MFKKSMKKEMKILSYILVVLLVFGLGVLSFHYRSQAKESDLSLEKIQEKGEFILGLDDAFPPMGFKDDDQNIIGFDIDLAKEVTNRMGVKLKIQPISWDAKELELETGNIDVIWNGVSVTPQRQEIWTMSKSYMNNRQVVVTLVDSDIVSLKDLAGKKVVLQNGSTASDAVDSKSDFKNTLKELIYVEDNVKALLDLQVSGSDAVIMDEVVARYYISLPPQEGKFKVLEETLSDEEYAVAFRKEDKALAQEVQKHLDEMVADGTMDTIKEKWFGKASAKDGSLEQLKSRGKFILGLDDAFPPMGFRDNEQDIVGFDIDLARLVTEKLGVELVLQPISWDAKELELETGNIDAIWNGVSISPQRQQIWAMTDSYMTNRQVAVVLADSKIRTLQDLAEKRVVIQNGSTASDAIDEKNGFKDSLKELIYVEDNVQALLDLQVSGSDAVIMDEVVARYYTSLPEQEGKFYILEESLSEEDYAVAFRKSDQDLANEVDRLIKELKGTKEYQEIEEKWFGKVSSQSLSGISTTLDKGKLIKHMLKASLVTIQIFFFTLLFSLPLGLVLAAARKSKFLPLSYLVKLFLLVMRGTPLILQLIFFYFTPFYVFGITLDRTLAAIIAFVLNYSAYFAEIYRSGIESIPVGQQEAARVLGFSKEQTFFKITLPQVIKRILPPMSNEFMTLIKDTALAQVIGVAELFQLANKSMSTYATIMPLVIAGIFYFVMNGVVSKCFDVAEKKLDYYQ